MDPVPRGTVPPFENTGAVRARALSWLRGELGDQPFDGLEEMGHTDVPVEVVRPGMGHVLDEMFPPHNLLQIRAERRFAGDRLEGYRLCASGYVGVFAVRDPENDLSTATVLVRPKVPGASLLTMLSYAFVPDLAREQRAQIGERDIPLVSLVVLLYLYRLEQLVRENGLQRTYIKREQKLRGTVRGRSILADYLGRQVPAGQAHIVPCRFWELCIDSEPNRALRWGIEVCQLLAHWLSPSGLVEQVEESWQRLAPHFSEVIVAPCRSSQVRRLPQSGRFVPYESVYELLEFLLDNVSLDLIGGKVRIGGFGVEMWQVFERFVVNVLASHMRGQIRRQASFRYEVRGKESPWHTKRIILDALVKGHRSLVLDAKWKEGILSHATPADDLDADAVQIEGLRIRNADLFQVVAYGKHREVQAQGGVLVYPVLDPAALCKWRCILDFVEIGGDRPFPVFLVGVPVGEALDRSINDFVARVRDISKGLTEIENATIVATI